MSSLPLSKFPPLRMQLAGNNHCVDHSPDQRFCAVTGDGQPAASALGPIRAQNNYHINITNHPGAIIDVGKIQDMISSTHNPAPGLLPLPTPRHLPAHPLDHNDLRRTLSNKQTSLPYKLGHPAPVPLLFHPGRLLTSTPIPCFASPYETATSRCPPLSAAGYLPLETLMCSHTTRTARSRPCGIRTPCYAVGPLAAARLLALLGPPPADVALS
jgi:hypothetical protein